MEALSNAYGILVLALSVTVIVSVWRTHKEKVKEDLRRVAKAMHLHR